MQYKLLVQNKEDYKIFFQVLYIYQSISIFQIRALNMSIRKTRIGCQGITNKSQSNLLQQTKNIQKIKTIQKSKIITNNLSKTVNINQSRSKYDTPNLNFTAENYSEVHQASKLIPNSNSTMNIFQSQKFNTRDNQFKRLSLKKLNNNRKDQNYSQKINLKSQKAEGVLQKIRSTYKYNANIRKIIKAWGFQSKGCISDQQFTQMIQKHFDSSITKQDCQELISQFSTHKKNLDLLSFIKLVFDQQPFTQPHIKVLDQDPVKILDNEPTNTLIDKIHNLNEGSLYNKNAGAKKQKKFCFPLLNSKLANQLKNTSASFILQNKSNLLTTQPSLYQTLHCSSSPKFNFFDTKSHGIDFNPIVFLGKNQQKTRFNATPFLQLNDQSLPENKRDKIMDEKIKIANYLQRQRGEQMSRYQNKLEKIRVYQRREKQNVMLIEKKWQERDLANMKKMREQNVAYNYVNFIHNDWK